ncbi:hypothetical protein HBI26_199550 [Parastagonospora nodorum]|nr:hypothetical protein HBH52_195550 [Parastagonospora nodorum]KAH4115162.1 hypothetical protein HBH47_184260 [Parastagonospora nodorum]KAH4956787.1 hypothetical protein HBI78_196700 [Parastagonospora nodorum]KAH5176962.1 hypothetical protein HBH76_209800 [Parastagonospora nodorum]KAH5343728.1 hypothetical protein HBI48_213520 [Parastagonospora nodorum]
MISFPTSDVAVLQIPDAPNPRSCIASPKPRSGFHRTLCPCVGGRFSTAQRTEKITLHLASPHYIPPTIATFYYYYLPTHTHKVAFEYGAFPRHTRNTRPLDRVYASIFLALQTLYLSAPRMCR